MDDVVLNFMQITSCKSYEKSLEYLNMTEFNLEQSVQLYYDLEHSTPIEEKKDAQQKQISSAERMQLIKEYQKYKQAQKTIQDESIFNKFVNLFKKQKDYGQEGIQYLEAKKIYLKIKFFPGNFEQNLEIASNQQKPLLLYFHHEDSLKFLPKINQNNELVQQIKQHYHSIVYLLSEETISKISVYKRVGDVSCFVIARKNLLDKIIFMAILPLNDIMDLNILSKQLIEIKNQFNETIKFETSIKNEAEKISQIDQSNQQLQSFFQPILSSIMQEQQQQYIYEQQQQQILQQQRNVQQQRYEQDRKLRDEQERAFRQAQIIKLQEDQKKDYEKQKKQNEEKEKQDKQDEILFKKAQILSNLSEEPAENYVQFQFRMPNGEMIERKFFATDQIQILFDFVYIQDTKYFDFPDSEDFDLIQTFPRISLRDKKKSIIQDIFYDSQMESLIVSE